MAEEKISPGWTADDERRYRRLSKEGGALVADLADRVMAGRLPLEKAKQILAEAHEEDKLYLLLAAGVPIEPTIEVFKPDPKPGTRWLEGYKKMQGIPPASIVAPRGILFEAPEGAAPALPPPAKPHWGQSSAGGCRDAAIVGLMFAGLVALVVCLNFVG